MRTLLCLIMATSLSGCLGYARWKEAAATAELREQQVQLLKDFRQCLADNSNHPERQRDCSVYNQSRSQIDITGVK